ncbi:MAG TPA: ATP-binding protein, partial [Woeseiaceae bacterium]|nr:ATP-binding protein [Woeseiaceae bacterium]
FWLIIGITIGIAALAGFYYAERLREAAENFEISDILLDASRALDNGGRDGLRDWLETRPREAAVSMFILDENDRDLLGRRVPRRIRYLLHRNGELPHRPGSETRPPLNLRPARPLSQLVSADGEVFTLIALPAHHPYRRWLDERLAPLMLLLALLVSGGISYLLARTVSRPVRFLRDATIAISDGALDTRVSPRLKQRRDELGLLARDFDSMAEKLQQAARQQTELSQNISHELRSPLARLRVALELARRQAGNLPEFSRIDVEAERLDGMIGQILRYSKLDRSAAYTASRADLVELLEEVVENVNYECRDEGIDGITVKLSATASPVMPVFPEALQSAVENVLRNAVKHSPANASIDVTLSADPSRARIDVDDRGPGVDETDLERLFEPFFRTRRAPEHGNGSGSGLGLAIAARAVRLHGGTIAARNRPEGGLRVTIELPRTA